MKVKQWAGLQPRQTLQQVISILIIRENGLIISEMIGCGICLEWIQANSLSSSVLKYI